MNKMCIRDRYMDVDKDHWIETIKTTVPPKFIDMNLAAFELGYKM